MEKALGMGIFLLVIAALTVITGLVVTCFWNIVDRIARNNRKQAPVPCKKTRRPRPEATGTEWPAQRPVEEVHRICPPASPRSPGPVPHTRLPETPALLIRVAGISFHNADGTSRQTILGRLRPGDPVELVPEPDNPFDADAIRLLTRHGQIGYVPRMICPWIKLLECEELGAWIHSIKRFDIGMAGCLVRIDPGPQPPELLTRVIDAIQRERSSAWLAGLQDTTSWVLHDRLE